MTEWKITVANKTGEDSASGEGSIVKFALFQVPSEKENKHTYPCAWVVDKIAYPGKIHDITLPNEFELVIVDEGNGNERITGPFPVSSGQEVYITQKSREDPPSHEIKEGEALDDNTAPMIQVFNNQGNIQPLTMVLSKKQKKLIMYDKVVPGSSVNMSVKQQIKVCDASNTNAINQGDPLKDQGIIASSTVFKLLPSTPRITIDVHREPSGQLSFKLCPTNGGFIDAVWRRVVQSQDIFHRLVQF